MANLNLILKLKRSDDGECETRRAERIKVDGLLLTVIDPYTGGQERVSLETFEVLSIRSAVSSRPAEMVA